MLAKVKYVYTDRQDWYILPFKYVSIATVAHFLRYNDMSILSHTIEKPGRQSYNAVTLLSELQNLTKTNVSRM